MHPGPLSPDPAPVSLWQDRYLLKEVFKCYENLRKFGQLFLRLTGRTVATEAYHGQEDLLNNGWQWVKDGRGGAQGPLVYGDISATLNFGLFTPITSKVYQKSATSGTLIPQMCELFTTRRYGWENNLEASAEMNLKTCISLPSWALRNPNSKYMH